MKDSRSLMDYQRYKRWLWTSSSLVLYMVLMKKYILYFSILSVLILSWCTDSNVEQTWTWEVATSWAFDSLIQEYSEDMDAPMLQEENNETKEKTENVEGTRNTGNSS